MKHLLFLIPSDSYRAEAFLCAAERVKVDVIVASDRHQTLDQTISGKLLTLDFLDLEASTAQVVQFEKAFPIAAVVATDESATRLAASISEALHLPYDGLSAVTAACDKAELRKRLIAGKVSTPDFQVFSLSRSPEAISEEVAYPVVLKPTFLSGSQGVIRADHRETFVSAFRRIQRLLKDPEVMRRNRNDSREILVESYIPGKELALEGLLRAGKLSCLAVFDKPDRLEGPFFEETLYVTPSRLSASIQKEILSLVSSGARTLGLKEGPIHAELRLDGEKLYLIELAARSIGGRCAKILRFGVGFSLEEVIVRHALRLPIASLKRQKAAAGVMMIPIPKKGILTHIQGLDEAKQVKGIGGVDITAHIGQEIIPLPEGRRYLGFIFAGSKTTQGVEAALREAHRKLTFGIASTITVNL